MSETKTSAAKGTKKPAAAKSGAEKNSAAAKETPDAQPVAPKALAASRAQAPAKSSNRIRVTQTGSSIGRQSRQEQTLIGLGLGKRHRVRELEDTPAVRGMIEKVKHLVKLG